MNRREMVPVAVGAVPKHWPGPKEPPQTAMRGHIPHDTLPHPTQKGQRLTVVSHWPDGYYMVGGAGLEPATPCMSSKYSNHLS